MKITLRAIDRNNYEECIALQVDPSQKIFVAENWYSLLQANYEPNIETLAIYEEDKMIKMILYDYDEEIPGWSMSRFMIDKKYQHQGYGKEALRCFLEYFDETIGKDLYTSAEIENETAIKLYQQFYFVSLNEFSYEHQGIVFHELRMLRKA